jgi:LCP family protein required for cell wall assembly
MVTIADSGATRMINSAYDRESGGERVLIDTLQQNYGIPINHFVEVNFESFKQVVDSVGGVPVWFETAARDRHSGFHSEDLGCSVLDGGRSLEFVRSRYLEVMIDGEWEHDLKSDEHRVLRQQIFVQRALSLALADVKSNPLRLQQLVDIAVSNITLDPNLRIGDIVDLAEQFKDFDASKLEAYALPVSPYPQDEDRLVLDKAGAEPMLNVFRGLPPGEIGPGLIDVEVLNGTVADPAQQRKGLATDVSGALQKVGFQMAVPGDADTLYAKTTIQHAPGDELYAQRVARHISSAAAVPTEVDPELERGQVRVIAGLDFTTVHEQATPVEAMPAPAGAGAEAPPETTVPRAETTATTAGPPATTPTTTNPFIIGAAPENADC